ncbi:HEAT repeat domain-containing protein [Tessaracoccus caeni]|uniref:HEAT repeat domain-containing protein n=1 Tax=Tessaracoccus caeni TaxID=3031239 RepID=UPI0023D9D708|nr:HEAT repeat domain-containing protein [Tessaracoccus caeni]MDF1489071.1 HEAT repeat domain-containing protein [Tessaracoccus caeni]
MTKNTADTRTARLTAALEAPTASARLNAAMAAGMQPEPSDVEVLIARCTVEPDFYVRDMLTWALTRHDASSTVEILLGELTSSVTQARSQALHTLSKIGDRRAWPAITVELLRDRNDDVARAAWRAAVVLVPDDARSWLLDQLASQFGRGDRHTQLSLSRAFASLGEASLAVVERAKSSRDEGVRMHAVATERYLRNPEEGFDAAIEQARRVVALRGAPGVEQVEE